MFEWLRVHWGTIFIALIVLAVIAGAIVSVVRDHKSGKGGCGGGCQDCAMRGECHKNHEDT